MKLYHRILIVILTGLLVIGLSACEKEGTAEKAGKAIDETASQVTEKADETASDVAEKAEEAKEAVEKKME